MKAKLLPWALALTAFLSMAWSSGFGTVLANGKKVLVTTGPSNGPSQLMTECGADAGTAGALSVTFQTAFVTLPSCQASDEKAIPLACGITAKSLSTVTFTCPTGTTEVIDYCCTGALY